MLILIIINETCLVKFQNKCDIIFIVYCLETRFRLYGSRDMEIKFARMTMMELYLDYFKTWTFYRFLLKQIARLWAKLLPSFPLSKSGFRRFANTKGFQPTKVVFHHWKASLEEGKTLSFITNWRRRKRNCSRVCSFILWTRVENAQRQLKNRYLR